jgi:hypothetical protein
VFGVTQRYVIVITVSLFTTKSMFGKDELAVTKCQVATISKLLITLATYTPFCLQDLRNGEQCTNKQK